MCHFQVQTWPCCRREHSPSWDATSKHAGQAHPWMLIAQLSGSEGRGLRENDSPAGCGRHKGLCRRSGCKGCLAGRRIQLEDVVADVDPEDGSGVDEQNGQRPDGAGRRPGRSKAAHEQQGACARPRHPALQASMAVQRAALCRSCAPTTAMTSEVLHAQGRGSAPEATHAEPAGQLCAH